MEVLFSFLNWTSSFSHVDEESGSKMDIHNLATVITPNILYPNAKNSTVDESFMAIEAVNALITYNDNMCEVCILCFIPPPPSLMTTESNHFILFLSRSLRIYNQSSVTQLCSKKMPK